MSGIHFIIGGSRSGKSRYAELLASVSRLPVTYVATYARISGAADAEMEARIEKHRQRRPAHWITVENRHDLRNLISESEGRLLLVDCLTLWLSLRKMEQVPDEAIVTELEQALRAAQEKRRSLILVGSELGFGLVPAAAEARVFRDLSGAANQLVALYAAKVELIVAGLPLTLKGEGHGA